MEGCILTTYYVLFYFFIYAFLGWCLEVIFNRVKRGTWVNRGFLNGPLCPIYGVGLVLIVFLVDVGNVLLKLERVTLSNFLEPPSTNALNLLGTFIMITLLTTGLELITGVILERLFLTKWWDYTSNKMNFKGYICLRFSVVWGIVGTLALTVLHPFVEWSVSLLNAFHVQLILSACLTLFVIDLIATIKALIDFRKLLLELAKVSEEYKQAKAKLLRELEEIIEDMEHPKVKIIEEISRINKGVNASKEKIKEEIGKFGEDLGHLRSKLRIHLSELTRSDVLPNGAMKDFLLKRVDLEQRLKTPLKTNIHEIYARFNKLTSKLSRNRFFRSFPDMQSDKFGNQLNAIRSKYEEARKKIRKK